MPFQSVAIVGYGSFGKLLTRELLKVFDEVLINDTKELENLPNGVKSVSLAEIAQAELVIISVTIQSFDSVLRELSENISDVTTVIDVCSVKTEPIKLMQKHLPKNTPIVGTHPLFGPHSVNDKDSVDRHVVICEVNSPTGKIEALFDRLNWKVKKQTADEHDKQMAVVHSLTFFVSQTLVDMKLEKPETQTKFYSYIQRLVEIQSQHSQELTETVESYNPYSAEIRERFLSIAQNLNEQYKK